MINGEEERQKIVISNLRLVSKQGWQMNKWQSSRCMQSIAKKLHLIAMVLQWQWKKKGNWKKLNRNKIRSTTFCNFVCGKGWSRKDQKTSVQWPIYLLSTQLVSKWRPLLLLCKNHFRTIKVILSSHLIRLFH